MKTTFKSFRTLYKVFLTLYITLMTNSVFAALPTMQAPSRQGNGLLDNLKNYGYDVVILGGLFLAAYGFSRVAGALIEGFGEVSSGKKKWGELGMLALVGALMLVVIIWLLTEAAKILV